MWLALSAGTAPSNRTIDSVPLAAPPYVPRMAVTLAGTCSTTPPCTEPSVVPAGRFWKLMVALPF
jgi:hypothetical protein